MQHAAQEAVPEAVVGRSPPRDRPELGGVLVGDVGEVGAQDNPVADNAVAEVKPISGKPSQAEGGDETGLDASSDQ